MAQPLKGMYAFGPFRLDATKRLLLREGEAVPLKPKAFEILLALVENSGRVIEKDELMSRVWANTVVEESNLAHHISALRKALDDNQGEHRYIVTIPGRGYSFVASVSQRQNESVDLVVAKRSRSQIVIEEEVNGEDESGQVIEQETSPTESALISPTPNAKPVARSLITRIKWHKRSAAIALALLAVAAAALIFALSRQADRNELEKTPLAVAPAVAQRMQITKITNTGNASWPAISPDGKYIAYVSRDVAGKSIFLKHLDTGSVHQILPPVRVRHLGQLSFSPDGGYVYYAKSEGFGPLQELYRLPVLGGVPTKIIIDLGYYTLSTDGARMAFVRNSRTTGESALMIANADGTAEHKLTGRKLSDGYVAIAWSPDGKVIACSVGSTEVSGERMYPVEVRVADGAERLLTSEQWVYLGIILWLADGSGILASGYFQGTILGIWHISYPGGEVRRLTDDANIIGGAGLTADSKTLVGQTQALQTNIWIAPIGDDLASPAALARQLTTGTSNYKVCGWMPDGRILFIAAANNPLGNSIWVMNADGTGRKQLTANAEASENPVYSPDGRYIVFVSNRAGRLNIWRMDADGGNPKQLTFGNNEKGPTCSPDGEWVVYTAGDDSTLWKVPMEGGEAEQLTDTTWGYAIFSPDGRWLASFHRDQQPDARLRIGILPFAGDAPVKMFEPPRDTSFTGGLRWSRDGQALIYAGTRSGITNLWRQPLEGGKPTPLTDFKAADEIYGFDLSPDGKQIAFARGAWTFDVVLIKNLL